MSSTTTSVRRARSRAPRRAYCISSLCSPKQKLGAAGAESQVFLSLEKTSSIVDGVKMPGPEGSLPSVLKIYWASTAQEMALYAIGVARKNGDYQPSSFCVRMILKDALPRIS